MYHCIHLYIKIILIIFDFTGNFTLHNTVACTNPDHYDLVMDCRNDGGIIEIIWDETVTFYGEKESTVMDSCQLKDGSCTTAVSGTNMEGRLEDLCGKQVRCTVEFEQTWVEDECGINTLNYLELVYKCVIPGTILYFL